MTPNRVSVQSLLCIVWECVQYAVAFLSIVPSKHNKRCTFVDKPCKNTHPQNVHAFRVSAPLTAPHTGPVEGVSPSAASNSIEDSSPPAPKCGHILSIFASPVPKCGHLSCLVVSRMRAWGLGFFCSSHPACAFTPSAESHLYMRVISIHVRGLHSFLLSAQAVPHSICRNVPRHPLGT